MVRRAGHLFAFLVVASTANAQMPPPTVGVIQLEAQAVPRSLVEPGRAMASAEVDIRPRVAGVVTEILYQAGRPVEAGDVLFRIEPSTYEADVRAAEADLAAARAAVKEAEAAVVRSERLLGTGTSQSTLDTARSTLEQARATLQSAEVARDLAQIDLERTSITSPITGIPGFAAVSVGDLVAANQADALATVTQLDPIDVEIWAPSARVLSLIEDISLDRVELAESITATLTLETGRAFEARGSMVATSQSVSETTGSRAARFRFENPRHILLPGMFVRADIVLGTANAILVPQSATEREPDGELTAWVVAEGRAVLRSLQEIGTHAHGWIVTEGVAAGELLAVDGLASLTPGLEVRTVPVELDEYGVVHDLRDAVAAGNVEAE
ncbi:RND family efflux transporter MFP subunit (plasmid) [Cereibacter sphaeroides WS8N]|uniref:efflux RND transporter periplasmic adaptor subunit n=1 Tax=Cereibacter sphaeroides TaxID=1063 RepID=UPI00020B0287|nr:efflux RND transporter periplasmic adaptor subunit [Cereibacter sphaeroides]EGJ19286.1 RND family efflux transporter MFP subunit [Cereibacter sphaeroides WS8N]